MTAVLAAVELRSIAKMDEVYSVSPRDPWCGYLVFRRAVRFLLKLAISSPLVFERSDRGLGVTLLR